MSEEARRLLEALEYHFPNCQVSERSGVEIDDWVRFGEEILIYGYRRKTDEPFAMRLTIEEVEDEQ